MQRWRQSIGFFVRMWATVLLLAAGAASAQPVGTTGQPGSGSFGGFGLAASASPITAAAESSAAKVPPGGRLVVAVTIDIRPPYHINPDPPRSGPAWFEAQVPTVLRPDNPGADIFAFGPVQYPPPHSYEVSYADQTIEVYSGQVVLYLPVQIAADAEPGRYVLPLDLEYQACDPRVCLPPTTLPLTVEVEVIVDAQAAADVDPTNEALFAGFDPAGWEAIGQGDPALDDTKTAASDEASTAFSWTLLLYTLAIAGLAGLLLNFTPCVLPVIPLKVMSLAAHGQADGGRARTLLLALVMAAGIFGFWLAIALAISSLKWLGNVNDLYQYPAFSLGVGVLIAVLAVSMMGLFTIPLPRSVYQLNPTGDTVAGSFGFGVMTAVLATPCAGPLMGSSVAVVLTQGTALTLLIFTALGVGMALPYLLLSVFPSWIAWLPRAGAGSELLKQVMGMLMLAAAAFFVGSGLVTLTADGLGPTSKTYWWVVGAIVAAAGVWLLIRGLGRAARTPRWRAVVTICGTLLIAAGASAGYSLTRADGIPWRYYTPQLLAEATASGQIVVLDFTAAWCLNCKALEKTVLESNTVEPLLQADDVFPIKVDITSRQNVAGNALLHEMGRVTIPLLVVFDPAGREVFKADFYTAEQVKDAIETARQAPRN